MRASFDTEQPSVKSLNADGLLQIFICTNGEWTDRACGESQETQRVWECDYREIICGPDDINLSDVRPHPEKYLDWKPKTDSEKIAELQEKNDMLESCLLEMSETVYA